MSHNGILNIYLFAVSLIALLTPIIGFLISKRIHNYIGSRVLLSVFLILGAAFCLDGYERANFLVSGYLENNSISKAEFNQLIKTIGLWKFVLPAVLAGVGISFLTEVLSNYLPKQKS